MPRRALIVGSSGGIGGALVEALEAQGTQGVGLSRRDDGLDLRDPASVARRLGRLEGPFDLILVASGILAPPGRAPERRWSGRPCASESSPPMCWRRSTAPIWSPASGSIWRRSQA